MNKFILIILTLLAFSFSGSAFSKNKNPNADPPNILLILSDDHSYPYLSCYGNKDLKTPNLDKLASEGILFNNAYTAASQCVPSRASILSGRNVIDIRMSRFSAPLSRDIKTIPDYLREKDYYTGICGRHYHLDGSARMPDETKETLEKYNMVTFPDRVDYLKIGSDEEVFGQFTTFLDGTPKGKPFFMWMNYSDPHRPFTATEFEPDPEKITVPASMPDNMEVRKDLAAHLGEVNRLDMHVGQVLDELKKRGLDKNTLVIFIGDNGAALIRGKGTLYDLGVHVPLIMRWPDEVPANKTTDAMVSGEDILPSILEAAGMQPDKDVTGKSFLQVIDPKKYTPHEYIFAQRGPHSSGLPQNSSYFDLNRTVFDEDYKLIYNINWQVPYDPVDFHKRKMWQELAQQNKDGRLSEKFSNAFFADPRPMFELYDRKNDPYEFNNLINDPKYAELVQTLKGKLHEWMMVYQDYVPLPVPPPKRKN